MPSQIEIARVKDASKHVVGESDCVRKLKDAVELRLPYRIKMSVAVQIATLLDPSTKHLIAADLTMDDMKKLLIENTKLAVERKETVRTRESMSSEVGPSPSASGSSGTGSSRNSNLADSVAAKDLSSPLPCSESSQPSSKKMKLLQKFRSLDGAGDVDFKIEGEVNQDTYLHLLTVRPVSRAAVIFPAGVRQFRLVRRRAVINPAGGGAKLFWRRLAARSEFLNLLTSSALLTVRAVIR